MLVVSTTGVVATMIATGEDRLGQIRDAAIVVDGDRIAWVGQKSSLADAGLDLSGADHLDAQGALITPGLIDCHAHPVFAGSRAGEFADRAEGKSYLDIAAAGGGIMASVRATRAASTAELAAACKSRLDTAFSFGTTTCEAKSGYDLTVDGELRLLEAARRAGEASPVDVSPTLLAAHAIPPERQDDRAGFVHEIIAHTIPRAAAQGFARQIDVYCDEGAFTVAETRAILTAGKACGLTPRAHVGQFSDLGGAELVAELGGASADHVENVSPEGIGALAKAGVVAVMLPGACVQLGMTPPPVADFRRAGVAMAVATDMNPGTTYCESLPLQMWLATTHYRMTVPEAWLGVTRHAARVLGRDDIGVIAPGARADLVVWNAETPADICYHYGPSLATTILTFGQAHTIP
ncbi:MAG TPA: imidazolonepropionase [Kofleriaceae bacterium]|nr:imidazolonepropionase [Kofleriaceae bacterium]